MRAYGTDREMKTSKVVSVLTDKGEETREEYAATYAWRALEGEVEIIYKSNGKKLNLLSLEKGKYKFTVNVKAQDPIEEEVQHQLEVKE